MSPGRRTPTRLPASCRRPGGWAARRSARLWFFLTRASKRWARISGTALSGSATVDGLGNLLAPEAVEVKIFWAAFWLIGLGAVVLLWPGSSSAFFKAAQS